MRAVLGSTIIQLLHQAEEGIIDCLLDDENVSIEDKLLDLIENRLTTLKTNPTDQEEQIKLSELISVADQVIFSVTGETRLNEMKTILTGL